MLQSPQGAQGLCESSPEFGGQQLNWALCGFSPASATAAGTGGFHCGGMWQAGVWGLCMAHQHGQGCGTALLCLWVLQTVLVISVAILRRFF